MRIGTTHGSIDSRQLRDALVEAEISPKRMKAVIRSLDNQGIQVAMDEATAHRAIAATATRGTRSTATASAKKTAAS
ncbi:MAG: polymerase primary sigma factor, partial [Actinomycetota bacterium]|nr:polymerase primary sigma factor [Actinomycetota bacterium]